jgi:hypothetical protein
MTEGVEYPRDEHGTHHDALQEHLELSHYITVFSASAGRVRYVMFIIMVLSVTIVVAQWNTTKDSWAQSRYKRLLEILHEIEPLADTTAADAIVRERTDARFGSRKELVEVVAEYRARLIDRIFFTEIPGLGIAFDVNDLGLFSGIAYTLLLLLLVFCLMREHENLYLALYKVMRLHDRQSRRPDGESAANFLYHALAMGTVFTTPPSLARWRPAAPQRKFLNIVFFVPALVQGYIVYTNYATLPVAEAYGAPPTIMVPQYFLLTCVFALGVVALIYADAANKRWQSAFFHLNPGLARVQQQPWLMWIRRSRFGLDNRFQRKLSAQAVQQLVCDDLTEGNNELVVTHALPVGKTISYDDVMQMCREIESLAMEKASALCSRHPELISANITSSALNGSDWVVSSRWSLRCLPEPAFVRQAEERPA